MKKRTEFLKPRLTGERFNSHTIPLEVLRDWAAFEDLIVETAKWLYKRENPSRERVPRGFTKDFSLSLSSIEEGSAIPVLEMDYTEDLAGPLTPDWFSKAKDSVIKAIKKASNDETFESDLPPNFAQYFDRFGRSLRDGEAFEFSSMEGCYDVSYTHSVRKKIVLSQEQTYSTEEFIRGVLSEVDAKTKTFSLEVISGERVKAEYLPEINTTVIDCLKTYDQGGRVLVHGTTVRDCADRLLNIYKVSRVESLEPLDVIWRLEEISKLKDGWYEGQGTQLSREGLKRLGEMWEAEWTDVLLPYIYPNLEGGVDAEWSDGHAGASVSINLERLTGTWFSTAEENEDGEIELDLSTGAGWQKLIQLVSNFFNKST